jgi:hypothetical protein
MVTAPLGSVMMLSLLSLVQQVLLLRRLLLLPLSLVAPPWGPLAPTRVTVSAAWCKTAVSPIIYKIALNQMED